ncbi:hypothetical protein GCM10028791_22110 [Echinicola sediminis]
MMMNKIKSTALVFCLLILSGSIQAQKKSLLERAEIPYIKGESKKAFDAKPSEDFDEYKWFTNDHCFVTDHNGKLHWIGINNPYPPEGKELYRYHPYLGHLSTDNPLGKWKREDFALSEIGKTEYLGAPYVVWHEESERWVMVLETILDNTRRLEVAWSDDLYEWERTYEAILPDDLWISSRDPHIMKGEDGKYWIHIVATGNEGVNQSQVLRIRTKDFENFESPETILGINDNTFATLMESPYLVERNGLYYLFFTYAHRRYAETLVIVSDDPDHFDYENNVLTTLFGHAAEVFEYQGKEYISSCGPEDQHYLNHQSTSIAGLGWAKNRK